MGTNIGDGVIYLNNEMYEIAILNKTKFLDMVVCTITKGAVKKFKAQRRYNIQ